MGRWGDDLYDSDAALDYNVTITMRLEREIALWVSPEYVQNEVWWLAQVLTVTELMLILESRDTRLMHFESEKLVQRWQDTILSVWDSNWDNEKDDYPYAKFVYRQTHRVALEAMFNRLKILARNFENSYEPYTEPISLLPEYPLPYFSVKRWTNSKNEKIVSSERIVNDLFVQIAKDIEFYLSSDRRERVVEWDMPQSNEEVLAAVDSLALFSNAYEKNPRVDLQTVQRWQDATIEIDKQFLTEPDPVVDEKYLNLINQTFNKLELAAQKYTPTIWW